MAEDGAAGQDFRAYCGEDASSVDELEGIFGLGSIKIRKYGEEIIAVVNS
jgi:hypothetical protein